MLATETAVDVDTEIPAPVATEDSTENAAIDSTLALLPATPTHHLNNQSNSTEDALEEERRGDPTFRGSQTSLKKQPTYRFCRSSFSESEV